jgi:Mrp family chromosome partitioning ATPase/capsular polysaccharide biosynthesis protein
MTPNESDSTDLRDYLRPLKARWWVVAIIALLAAGGTYRHYENKPTTYSASTSLYLQAGGSPLDSILGGSESQIPQRSANNQAVLLRTTPVARAAAKRLDYQGDPRALLGLISVAPSADADFLNLTAKASTAQGAIRVVNAFAEGYIATRSDAARQQAQEAIRSTESQMAKLPRGTAGAADRNRLGAQLDQLRTFIDLPVTGARRVEPAATAKPERPSPVKYAIFAFAVGALLGLGLVYGFEFFDRRLKRVEDLPHFYGQPVLIGVPRAGRPARESPPSLGLVPPFMEAFRALRTALQLKATGSSQGNGRPFRVLLVASAIPREGKSTVARNLALAYHEAGLRVTVVDADLRRPQVAAGFGIAPAPEVGLTEVLTGEVAVADALIEVPVDAEGIDQMVRVREAASHSPRARADEPVTATAAPAPAPAPATLPQTPAPPAPIAQTRRRGGLLTRGRPTATVPASPLAPRPAAAKRPRPVHNSQSVFDPRLSILPAGRTPKDPAAVLTAGAFSALLENLAESNDLIIVDSAPLLAVSDGVPLLSAVDGVLLVSRIGLTTTTAVRHLNDLLRRVHHVNILGVVANNLTDSEAGYGAAYGYGVSRRRRLWRR